MQSISHQCLWRICALACVTSSIFDLSAFEQMSPGQIVGMTDDQRMAFVNDRLGAHKAALIESAKRNRVPARILAAVLLNELADYGWTDVQQEKFYSEDMTIGIGQTSVNNVLKRDQMKGLITEEELTARIEKIRHPNANLRNETRDRERAMKQLTWDKLNIPALGIEVAARELSRLMDLMSAAPGGNWNKHFLKGPIVRKAPLENVKAAYYPGAWNDAARIESWEKKLDTEGNLELNREISLTLALDAAYNSEKILFDSVEFPEPFSCPEKTPYKNARAHAVNATFFWSELLYDRNWPEGTDVFEGKWMGTVRLMEGSIAKPFRNAIPKFLKQAEESEAKSVKEMETRTLAEIAKISDAKERQERMKSLETNKINSRNNFLKFKHDLLIPLYNFIDGVLTNGEFILGKSGVLIIFQIVKDPSDRLFLTVTNVLGYPIDTPAFVQFEHPRKRNKRLARNSLRPVNDAKDADNHLPLLDKNPLYLRMHRSEKGSEEIRTNSDLKEYEFKVPPDPENGIDEEICFRLNWSFKKTGEATIKKP